MAKDAHVVPASSVVNPFVPKAMAMASVVRAVTILIIARVDTTVKAAISVAKAVTASSAREVIVPVARGDTSRRTTVKEVTSVVKAAMASNVAAISVKADTSVARVVTVSSVVAIVSVLRATILMLSTA